MHNTCFFKLRSRFIATVWTCIMLASLPAVPVQAADAVVPALSKPSSSTSIAGTAWHYELGMRYWFSWDNTAKTLYGYSRADMVSRLTYSGMTGNAGELFGQAIANRIFVKGFVGLGTIGSGNLQDEDFPPDTTPYSSTNSPQRQGSTGYVTIDTGYYFMQTPSSRIGGFIGYNYLNQKMNAYGCTQTASNTACTPAISTAIHVINQSNNWYSMRIGVNGETHMGAWMLSGDAAVLPLVRFSGADSHLLRIGSATGDFAGSVPSDGHGWGYQLQMMINYWETPNFSLGLGARYWHMQVRGYDHFEGRVVGSTSIQQPLDWKTTLYGVTAQCAVHF